jgi:hypothetical protein
MTLGTADAFDAAVAVVIPLVDLLTSSPVLRRKNIRSSSSPFQPC